MLTEAAISGRVDHLLGLKENVIIGKLIPARAEIDLPPPLVEEVALPDELALEEGQEPSTDISEKDVSELMGAEPEAPPEPLVPTSYIAEPDED